MAIVQVLIVDDSAEDRQLYRLVLRDLRETLELLEAESWAEAAPIIEQEPLAAIILDMRLSDARHSDVIDAISRSRNRNTALIVCSGLDVDDVIEALGGAAVHRVMSKDDALLGRQIGPVLSALVNPAS